MGMVSDITGSFYSTPFYAHVAQVRRGIGMKFIWILTIISVLLVTGYLLFYSANLQRLAEEVPKFASQLPQVTIKNGKFSIDKPTPYTIPIGTGTEARMITIDTNYTMGDPKDVRAYMESNKIVALITQDNYITLKQDSDTLQIDTFQDFKQDVTITRNDWLGLAGVIMEKGVMFLIIFTFVTLLIGLLIYNLCAVFIWAIVMLVMGYMIGRPVELGTAMRLTAAARMPCVAIVFAPLMFGAHIVVGGVSWLIWFAYLFYALTASQRGARA